jgi:hypothetical protein
MTLKIPTVLKSIYLESTSYILGNFLDSRFILDKRHTSEGTRQ